MKPLVSVVLLALAICSGAFAAAQQPWGFSVQDAEGVTRLRSSLRDVPYKPGLYPTVFMGNGITPMTVVRGSDGQVISSFGFYGWMEGTTIRVAVLAQVPPQGAENTFYRLPNEDMSPKNVRFDQIAIYTLAANKPTPIVEMKALGLEPMTLTAEVGTPLWGRGRGQ